MGLDGAAFVRSPICSTSLALDTFTPQVEANLPLRPCPRIQSTDLLHVLVFLFCCTAVSKLTKAAAVPVPLLLFALGVADNCGHTFCGACMERWIDNAPKGECPVCRTPVDKLVPVRKMDEVCCVWLIANQA